MPEQWDVKFSKDSENLPRLVCYLTPKPLNRREAYDQWMELTHSKICAWIENSETGETKLMNEFEYEFRQKFGLS